MSSREAYKKKIKAQLDMWKAEVDRLQSKARFVQADLETEFNQFLNDFKEKQSNLRKRLDHFEDVGEDAWEDLRSGLDKAAEELKTSVRKASQRFE